MYQIIAIFKNNIKLIASCDKAIYYLRVQNYDKGLRQASQIIDMISSSIDVLLTNMDYFNEAYEIVNEASIMAMLDDLLSAQENRDYLLLSDIYEYQLIPFLLQLQTRILQDQEFTENEADYEENLRVLANKDKSLLTKITALPAPETLGEKGYSIEYTSSGLRTLALFQGNSKYYLHSNNQVLKEAFTLANSWYSSEKTTYIIYGLGLGYHIKELHEIDQNIRIEVYESDLNVIQAAYAYGVCGDIIQKDNIRLLYDAEFENLIEAITKQEKDAEFLIHYPSIRNIKNLVIKEKLENYFVQHSSIKNQLPLLNGNFKKNIGSFDGNVDELREHFRGKSLYIIAAGPSLDKNFQLLEKVKEDGSGIILATGTVFKKLMKAGITPDYILVTDANPRVYKQISGLEDCDVPMLFLSTSYQGFTANYQGKKYLVCQQDYYPAEKYAQQHGLHCFRTGGSVSTTALDIGITFECCRIIFLGLDLAYTDGYAHASDTSRRNATDFDNLRKVEDIHGKLIPTNRSLDMFRTWIENRIKDVEEIEFIDATEGGAKIKGMRIEQLVDVIK